MSDYHAHTHSLLPTATQSQHMFAAMRPPLAGVRAIVIGATGACGQFAVDALVRSPSTDAVTVVVRRHRDFASEFGWNLAQARA